MVPADSPGRFGVSDVALVGNGTVSVVAVSAVARACATSAPPRTKLITGSPKAEDVNPLPVIVKATGGEARSIALGVIPLTIGTGRVSFTVSATLPSRL